MTGFVAQEVSSVLPQTVFTVESNEHRPQNITFYTGVSEMLKITPEGFYVKGKLVPADDKEAEAVYKAFKQFLVHFALTKEY